MSAPQHTYALQATETQHALHLYFCAWAVAGVRTQYENIKSVATGIDGFDVRYVEINPYKAGGVVERLPLLGDRTRGSIRSFLCTLPLMTEQAIDAVWTQADTALFPFLAMRAQRSRIPYVLSTDATSAQVERFAAYGTHETSPSLKHRVRDRIAAYVYRRAAYVLPWSRWAADAIVAQFGVPEERIRVVPPGVDLRQWPVREAATTEGAGRPVRLLFVGGDFERKGGPLLLDVFRTHFRERCELHLVTRDAPASVQGHGVHVYSSFTPNDPALHALYETCDALVLPTLADCFSMAAIEAMASGLPVIISSVGGIPEIIDDGHSGWLIPVGDAVALRGAIQALLDDPARGRVMGLRGRAIVEERFDAEKNARYVFDLIRDLCEPQRS